MHYAKCHITERLYAKCHITERLYAKCCYAECLYAESRGTHLGRLWLQSLIKVETEAAGLTFTKFLTILLPASVRYLESDNNVLSDFVVDKAPFSQFWT